MMKKLVCLFLSIFVIFTSAVVVHADTETTDTETTSTATGTLTPSATEVKQGETFTVKLHVECEGAIDGIVGLKFNYDTTNLELKNQKVDDYFSELESETEGTKDLMALNPNSKSVDVYEYEFQVKETATVGTEISVSTDEFTVYRENEDEEDDETEVQETVEALNTKVTVVAKSSGSTTDDPEDPTDEPTDPEEQKNPSTPSGKTDSTGTTGSTDDKKGTGTTGGTTGGTTETGEKTAGKTATETKSSETTAKKSIPYTGAMAGIGIAVIVAIAIGIVSYMKYNKYKKV